MSPLAIGSNRLAADTTLGASVGGAGGDKVTGFKNAKGGRAADVPYGSGAANVLEGNAGIDYLFGYGGNNRLNGGDSVDILVDGTGRDILIGCAGADTFTFTSTGDCGRTAATRDLIADFEDGQDTIALQRIDAVAGTAANEAFTFIGSNVAFSG